MLTIVESLREGIARAPRSKLDEIATLLWRAYSAGEIADADAEELDAAIQVRIAVPAAPTSARRPVGSRPRSDASMARRRRWVASGWLPPRIADSFTSGEAAVLAVLAQQVSRFTHCTLAIGNIAALAGVSDSTVQRALRHARSLGLIVVEERRLSYWRNQTNVISIISPEWTTWLRARGGGGCQLRNPTNTQLSSWGESRAERRKKGASEQKKRRSESRRQHPPEQAEAGS